MIDLYVTKNQKNLRCGITTGTCSAAAAKAAVILLLTGRRLESVKVHTPKGITVDVPVFYAGAEEKRTEKNIAKISITETSTAETGVSGISAAQMSRAEAVVIKDSGDDPDVTDRAEIHVSVEKLTEAEEGRHQAGETVCFECDEYPGLYLDGGTGVGRVTKEGLEQAIGQAAINKVPRQMIFRAVGEVCSLAEYREPLLIRVHVPGGEEIATRTFNGKLGIEGGISILGTGGIVEPMSEKAIVDTIEAQIRQRQAWGERRLLITPGNYGQAYIENFLHLSLEKSIKCSNYIGETLDMAVSYGMEQVLLVGNIGKLCKLAAGIMNTHSRAADGRWEIFAAHTALCGGNSHTVKQLAGCVNTEEMLRLLDEQGMKDIVMESMCSKIAEHLQDRSSREGGLGACAFEAMLFSEKYGFLGCTPGAFRIAEELR